MGHNFHEGGYTHETQILIYSYEIVIHFKKRQTKEDKGRQKRSYSKSQPLSCML